jgi:hypothetical protein
MDVGLFQVVDGKEELLAVGYTNKPLCAYCDADAIVAIKWKNKHIRELLQTYLCQSHYNAWEFGNSLTWSIDLFGVEGL